MGLTWSSFQPKASQTCFGHPSDGQRQRIQKLCLEEWLHVHYSWQTQNFNWHIQEKIRGVSCRRSQHQQSYQKGRRWWRNKEDQEEERSWLWKRYKLQYQMDEGRTYHKRKERFRECWDHSFHGWRLLELKRMGRSSRLPQPTLGIQLAALHRRLP